MKHVLFIIAIVISNSIYANDFNKYFENATLRIDYLFSGDVNEQMISVSEYVKLPEWAGRRIHLNEAPIEYNCEIVMKDKTNTQTLYRNTFSCFFTDWLLEEEAKHIKRSIECVQLLPFPKDTVIITVYMRDSYHKEMAHLTHMVNPKDELIRKISPTQATTPFYYLMKNGPSSECIDLVVMAEGYNKKQMEQFRKDAATGIESIFNYVPFCHYKDRFNVIVVESESRDSAVSIPHDNKWYDTALGAHFDTFHEPRLLFTEKFKQIHNLLEGIPYEHIIILANTDTYGGGGVYNTYMLTTAHHPGFKPVIVHEFGHSFGALTDEYAYSDEPSSTYPYEVEPYERNITTKVDFASKWEDMMNDPEVSLFEGGGYSNKGIYRCAQTCRMRDNVAPTFCKVCQRAIEQMIKFYTEE